MRLHTAFLILGLGALPGCAALSALQGEPDRDLYELRTPTQAPTGCGRANINQLVVELPKTRGTLDRDRIMIRPSVLQTQYLPDAQWGDTVPAMLQRLLVQSFSATDSFDHVGRAPLGVAGDYALISEIEDFNAEFGTDFSDAECDTVGGLILNHLGRVPKRKEEVDIGKLHFQVLRADRRRLYTLLVTRRPPPDALA